jgi:hypothetical protein
LTSTPRSWRTRQFGVAPREGQFLTAAEVAIALVLLTGAGLLLRSLSA